GLPPGRGGGAERGRARPEARGPARALDAEPFVADRGGEARRGPLAVAPAVAALGVLPRGRGRREHLPSVPLSPSAAARGAARATGAGPVHAGWSPALPVR